MIKYVGSKRELIPHITAIVRELELPEKSAVADLFAGTTRVGQALKREGFHVCSNDAASYSKVFADAYIKTDGNAAASVLSRCFKTLRELNDADPVDGYVTETFCRRSRYFQEKNGMKIDAVRAEIAKMESSRIEPEGVVSILKTALIEAADAVDSTCGLQMSYLKDHSSRSYNDLTLKTPRIIRGTGDSFQEDAIDFLREMRKSGRQFEFTYIDPPYSTHSYFGNYHIWETLARGDEPEVYGIACKRTDNKTNKSEFSRKSGVRAAIQALISELDPERWTLFSYSEEGLIDPAEIIDMLEERKLFVCKATVSHKKYIGSSIGIYNLKGELVGEPGSKRVNECLILAGPDSRMSHLAMQHAIGGWEGVAIGELRV